MLRGSCRALSKLFCGGRRYGQSFFGHSKEGFCVVIILGIAQDFVGKVNHPWPILLVRFQLNLVKQALDPSLNSFTYHY